MGTLEQTAARLAALLTGGADAMADPTGRDLIFEDHIELRALARTTAPGDVWAVDGGQALVADARCLAVYVTRAATVRWRDGASTLEDEGILDHHLLGAGEGATARATLAADLAAAGTPLAPGTAVDVNLLRDWGEWRAVDAAVARADPGATVLVDGDLQPDWRIPSAWLAGLLRRALDRGVVLVGVTKHSSLAHGGAPLLGVLEQQAAATLGPRAMWWAQVATTRPDVGAGLRVVVARLDPDARFAFRVDLPRGADPSATLGALSAVADDAAFPGYPYPLSVADRLAACPRWLREDVWHGLRRGFDVAGVPDEVSERAFADRHRLMERG
ncbi:MAG TPA: DNA double-strand break repair nuclease NurA [Acidimicrobiales bacterium]|nr:DNA double-strand break repair nuclease NurA [Acidimicrobiales bacterium]